MRTGPESKSWQHVIGALGFLAAVFSAPVMAAESSGIALPQMSASANAILAKTPNIQLPPPPIAAPATEIAIPSLSISAGDLNAKGAPGMTALENKVTDSAKESMKTLASPIDTVSLEDLNNAKIALAKIDVMIELEKHLTELDKVRNEREGKSSIAPIPVSALAPPPQMPLARSRQDEEAAAMTSLKLDRIAGGAGHRSAVLSDAGQEKLVHIGDKLPGGSLVTDISATSVTLSHDGSTHQLDVTGVNMIYGSSP